MNEVKVLIQAAINTIRQIKCDDTNGNWSKLIVSIDALERAKKMCDGNEKEGEHGDD